MEIPGRVQNGVVVFEGATVPPEGTDVIVFYPAQVVAAATGKKGRIEVPLVRTGEPGTVNLTGERIAEILDEEDVSPWR